MRTDDELRILVEAIHGSPAGTQEKNWLEWKNGPDLTKAAGKFAVAKAILGFANRSVEQAQLACEGITYMVVGAEPGAAAGVGAVDHADLGQAIKTYVYGTRWTPFYVPFDGVTVLVIVVEAPRPGDPIHSWVTKFVVTSNRSVQPSRRASSKSEARAEASAYMRVRATLSTSGNAVLRSVRFVLFSFMWRTVRGRGAEPFPATAPAPSAHACRTRDRIDQPRGQHFSYRRRSVRPSSS